MGGVSQNIEGIIDSFRSIGRVCGRAAEGRQMAEEYQQRLEAIERKTAGLRRPRVMFAIDRVPAPNHLADVYIAGADGYFDRMIAMAGGENAYRERRVRFPTVSPEGILAMNPEVIIDLLPNVALERRNAKSIAADWDELAEVAAVRNHRVFVFSADSHAFPARGLSGWWKILPECCTPTWIGASEIGPRRILRESAAKQVPYSSRSA